jgi:hypothetical protein
MDQSHLNILNLSLSQTTFAFGLRVGVTLTHPVQGAGPGSNTLNRFALIRVKSAF